MATSADPITDPRIAPQHRVPWVPLAWFAGILILCYLPTLIPLVRQWIDDEDMGHGFFVPFFALYMAYKRSDLLLAEPARPNYLGVAVLVYAAIQWYIGSLGAELFLQRTAFVLSIAGSILLFMVPPLNNLSKI